LIADGVIPSNDGRGYVLRRILRRAALFGRKLGLTDAFLTKISDTVIGQMGSIYPELTTGRDYILNVIDIEEGKFDQTLSTGMNLLDEIIAKTKQQSSSIISGEDVFRLYDTFGFPKEITSEIADENGLSIDLEGFEKEMEAQRERARGAKKFGLADKSDQAYYESLDVPVAEFVGYDTFANQTRVTALIVDGEPV
ncbi:MAG: alanine--tRNA ligase, partial [Planctomycetes bacterium]|nr:alanine--tRNA ligase [Planctomycetota bacterium]